ncbi:MAG: DUF3570 domain-containing protein [Myxococcota bacterium]
MVATRRLLAWLRALGRPAERRGRRRRAARGPRRAVATRPAAPRGPSNACLEALTAAALALPGLAASLAPLAPAPAGAAPRDELRLQYGRYEEDDRRLPGVKSRFDPIDVDYLNLGATVGLLDRWTVSLDYFQDTWSGATPIASAPQSLFGNRASAPDGVSGATPYLVGDLSLDGDLRVLESDLFGTLTGRADPGLVHTLSSASPETRKEVDFGLDYEWDDATLGATGGISVEPDYVSGFARLEGGIDLARKRTRLELGSTLSRSAIDAHLDHDAVPYIDVSSYAGEVHNRRSGSPVLRDERTDLTLDAGLRQILTPTTRLSTSLQYKRSEGYLANPYKVVEVAFIDPAQQFLAPPGGYYANVHALLERRPGERNQLIWTTQLLQDVTAIRGALSLRYALAHDDWGIDAHTLEAQWRQQFGTTWLVTPRFRYTSQGAADFYQPFLVSQQAYQTIVSDPDGNVLSSTPFDPRLLPGDYSGDHRLSAFGVLTGGIALQKRLFRGFLLDLGFEYSRYAGSLRAGGGGEAGFTRYDAWLVNASLRIDLATLALARESDRELVLADGERGASGEGRGGDGHAGGAHAGGAHDGRGGPAGVDGLHAHASGGAPAGVMFAHALPRAGDFMIGYRTTYMRRDGNIVTPSRTPSDGEIASEACGADGCTAAAESMVHQMHMLDLMVAPTRWLTLMLMPSYVDQQMRLRALDGVPPDVHSSHDHHATGGVGDTRFGPILGLVQRAHHQANLALVVSAPTGDTSQRFRRDHQSERGFIHYDMQLGSGTWDFLPALTYQGERGRLRFGAQAGATIRMEEEGRTGYALGHEAQLTAWGGVRLTDWLGGTLRFLYTHQGRIHGRYDRPTEIRTPGDLPSNSGGELFDVGFGLSATVPRGAFEGMQLSLEWLQPVAQDWGGYQLERTGTLAATWGMVF